MRKATFDQVFSGPAPSCSVVTCELLGNPKNIRHKFANALFKLAESSGLYFGGYIMRRVNECVEVMIVVNPCKEEDLGVLYTLLRQYNVIRNSFSFEETNYVEVNRLDRPFTVIRQGAEPDNFSNENEAVNYEVANSIHSHSSSRI